MLVYYTSILFHTLTKNIYDPTSYFTLALFPSTLLFACRGTFEDIMRASYCRVN